MTLTPDSLRYLLRAVFGASRDEITCGDCYDRLDRFAEMELAGLDPCEALPRVREHLDLCGECQEEFEALLLALQAGQPGGEAWRGVALRG